jgi:predicted nucleotidyltransferase
MTSSTSDHSRHLPAELRERVTRFAAAVSEQLGDALCALVVFGGAARGDYVEGQSDVDLIVVLREAPLELLQSLSNTLQLARFQQRFEVMLLTEADVQGAADVFPILYRDIQECHVLLAGKDVFSGLQISREHLRLRIEQELRESQIRMRRMVVDSAREPRLIAGAVSRKCKQLRSPLRALLGLLGHACGVTLREVLAAAATRFELELEPLHNPATQPMLAAQALARLLERSVQTVDSLPSSAEAAPQPAESKP